MTFSEDIPPKEGFLVWCHYLRQICFGNFLSGLLQVDKWILCIRNICSEAGRLISRFPEMEAVPGGFCSSPSCWPWKKPTTLLRGQWLQPCTWDTYLSVALLISQCQGWEQHCWLALVRMAKSQTRRSQEHNLDWAEQDFQPLGCPCSGDIRRDETSLLAAIH